MKFWWNFVRHHRLLLTASVHKAGPGGYYRLGRQVRDIVIWLHLLEQEVFLAAAPQMKLICILICFGEHRKFKIIILLILVLEQEAKNASLCWVQREEPHPSTEVRLLSGRQHSTSSVVEAEGQGRQDLPALAELTYGWGCGRCPDTYTNSMWGRLRRRAVSAATCEQWVSRCTQSLQKSITGRENSRLWGSERGRAHYMEETMIGPIPVNWRENGGSWGSDEGREWLMPGLVGHIRSLDLPKEKWHLWRDFNRGVGCCKKIPFVYQGNQPGWREEGGGRMS